MKHHSIHLRTLGMHAAAPAVLGQTRPLIKLPHIGERRQELRDKLCVAGVTLLVVTTLALWGVYLVGEAPRWSSGSIGGFMASTALVVEAPAQPGAATQGQAAVPGTEQVAGMSRTTLVLSSMAVEMVIFVGLGLYLRWDMKRES